MKNAVITGSAVVGLLMLVAVMLFACPKGTEPYKDTCVENIQPESAAAVQPSDEKLPEGRMPSYQREGITVVDAPNMALSDEKADQDKADAVKEGKHRAGIK